MHIDTSTEGIARDLRASRLVYATCMALNEGRWSDFLESCDSSFHYRIVNFSPEIKKTQCWMEQDMGRLVKLIELLPKHNSDHAALTRHATVYAVDASDPAKIKVTSQVAIYRTEWDGGDSHLESGATRLFVVGRYLDVVAGDGPPRLLQRTVDLDTRQVGIGSHFIL